MSASPSKGRELRADVCIVGAGPAGLTLAHELADSGLQVLLLESGPGHQPPGGVPVPSTRNVGLPYSPSTTRSAGVGGSVLWDIDTPSGPHHVRLKELDPLDFEDRGVWSVAGWPLSYAELAPHYRRARELFHLPELDPGLDVVVRGRLHRRHYSFGRSRMYTHDVPTLLGRHPRTTLLAGHTVTGVQTGPGGTRVTSVEGWSESDGRFSVQARAYVLAGGGIENARLLLASRSGHPAGVGNHHDQVGRYSWSTPTVSSESCCRAMVVIHVWWLVAGTWWSISEDPVRTSTRSAPTWSAVRAC